jgi:hypothetical protein
MGAVVGFPEPDPEPKKGYDLGSAHDVIKVDIDPLAGLTTYVLTAIASLFGDMTVGDVLAEVSRMPLKDFLKDVLGIAIQGD